MALERFWSKLVYLEDKMLDYYDGYRYWKRKGARLGPTIGRRLGQGFEGVVDTRQ